MLSPPRAKKSSSTPTSVDAEHLGEQLAEQPLPVGAARSGRRACEPGRGQGGAVQLAVGGQRQRVERRTTAAGTM